MDFIRWHVADRSLAGDVVSEYSVQIKRLLSAEDDKSLLSIEDNAERKECKLKLFKRQRRADQVEIMWMKGEISK